MVALSCLCHKLANEGMFSIEVGKNYFLTFTDWVCKDSTTRLIVIALLCVHLKQVPQDSFSSNVYWFFHSWILTLIYTNRG